MNLVEVDLDGMVHLLHSLLSVWVDLYSTIQRLFSWRGYLLSKVLSPVAEIPHKLFAARRSVCAMLQVDHVTHLGGIFLSDWLTMKYNRVGKTAGSENLDLDFLGLNLILPGCSFWLLEI